MTYTIQHTTTTQQETIHYNSAKDKIQIQITELDCHNSNTGKYTPGQLQNSKNQRWDPFMHPELLMELRPGKNAITYNWSLQDEDDTADKWINQYTLQTSLSSQTRHMNDDGTWVPLTPDERVIHRYYYCVSVVHRKENLKTKGTA